MRTFREFVASHQLREAWALAASLWIVCVAVKVPVLVQRDFLLTPGFVCAVYWQDALFALGALPVWFALARGRLVVRMAYLALVLYLAVNSVLLVVLSSPLTVTMARAAGGALRDSIMSYVTLGNCAIIGTCIGIGMLLPIMGRRLPGAALAGLVVAGCCAFVGASVNGRTNTDGLERNAILTLVRSTFPRVPARAFDRDWRAVPFSGAATDNDLRRFIGAASNRNVVWISLESTGAQYLAPWGATNNPTPNLAHLAKQSILFENAYAVYPESIKGLLSTFCSVYPAIDASAESQAKTSSPSLGHLLARAGYTNALFHSGRFMYLGMESVVDNRGFHVLCDAGAISGNVHSSFGVDEPATVEKILEWVDTLHPAQRFFLCYLPIAGHHPYDAPERGPFPGDTERDRYLNALWYGDKALGRLLQELQRRQLYTNTLFVIYGDHGEAFGQHAGNYGHTLHIYEENVRVPLLLAAPGLIKQQMRIHGVASLVDVAPTIADLLGQRGTVRFQGASLLRDQPSSALFFTDYSMGLLGLRDRQWKYIYEIESGRSQLFDLERDPEEQRNLAFDEPKRVVAYRQHLLDWAGAQRHGLAARRPAAQERLSPDQTPSIYQKSNRPRDRYTSDGTAPAKSS